MCLSVRYPTLTDWEVTPLTGNVVFRRRVKKRVVDFGTVQSTSSIYPEYYDTSPIVLRKGRVW